MENYLQRVKLPRYTGAFFSIVLTLVTVLAAACSDKKKEKARESAVNTSGVQEKDSIFPYLTTEMFTADPSAHVFNGTLYIYPSHDYESGIPADDLGSHFDMKDYYVFSMDRMGGEVTNHGKALDISDVPWAGKQMWAPDAARKGNTYYLYFPAKDRDGIFRIGAATSHNPTGPFKALQNPIEGSFSIDPAVFEDDDGRYYMYFGGIWGGQLQRWASGEYKEPDTYPGDQEPALSPKIAKLAENMVSFEEKARDVVINDADGQPIKAGDNERRFFEAAWVHKYNDTYYLSYSTGDTHYIAYATADNPYGPFTYQGIILDPVIGWTNHHSIVAFEGKWWLFFHDSSLSNGQTHLRSVKYAELTHNADGSIKRINAYGGNAAD